MLIYAVSAYSCCLNLIVVYVDVDDDDDDHSEILRHRKILLTIRTIYIYNIMLAFLGLVKSI